MAEISTTTKLILLLFFVGTFFSTSSAQKCKSQAFTGNKVFTTCSDLPFLNAFLHWSYFPNSGTVDIAYRAAPASQGGWVAWAVNPKGKGMLGSQAIVGYVDGGKVTVITTSVNGYDTTMAKGPLSFPVSNLRGETSGNDIILYASLKLNSTTVNQVWQTGPVSGGQLGMHASTSTRSVGTLDLASGLSTASGGVDSRTRRKNIHGFLNVISWGVLMPIGAMIARYMRVFEAADPAWFYLHVTCQFSAYILGVAGWGTGLKLGSESKGIQQTVHRNIGITLFVLATLQVFALLLRPKKDHKYRIYWNVYHHSIGYSVIILSIVNILKGFGILLPEKKYKHSYLAVISSLAAIIVLLEAITWIVVLKRKSRQSEEKSHHGHGANGTNGYGGRSGV